MNTTSLQIIKENIDLARSCQAEGASLKIILVITGSALDRESWQTRFDRTRDFLFGKDTTVLCLEEKIGNKTRAGNFLGTLLAYRQLKIQAAARGIPYDNFVTLAGMIIGRGERVSPFTQIEGNRKPAIKVNCSFWLQEADRCLSLAAIEEALFYFVPVGRYLEQGGFRGILDKWGDETEIASIDLQSENCTGSELADRDLIKFVSVMKITPELAEQKDWVVFDEEETVLIQLSRNKKEHLISRLKEMDIKPAADGEYWAGVSLGPVAVSYAVLDLAAEIFAHEITAENVYFDFDPYFMMAITLPDDEQLWNSKVEEEAGLKELTRMVPGFFGKVQTLKTRFRQKYGRPLNIKVCNLGSDVYWADIGQHKAMAEKFLSLRDTAETGEIARYLENITGTPDAANNIVINSRVSAEITLKNSVVINSTLTGSGVIENSVVKQSTLHNPELKGAFAVLSCRTGSRLVLNEGSGIYSSIGDSALVLEPGMRSGTLFTNSGAAELKVAEDTDLRNREANYDRPVYGNPCSFREAFNSMQNTGMAELEARRAKAIEAITGRTQL